MTSRIWFIIGANRGIGLEITRAALAAGDRVAATARRRADIFAILGEHESLLALDLDVTRPDQIAVAVAAAQAQAHFGGIDVLVNNAGYGHIGLFQETSDTVRVTAGQRHAATHWQER